MSNPRTGFPVGLLLVVLVFLFVQADAHPWATALAPFEIYADGFIDVRGVAVDAEGHVYVSDRERGTVTQITPNGGHNLLARRLERPVGLVVDRDDRLLIAEEGAGRVVRLEPAGRPTEIATGLKKPRWIVQREDGTLFLTARGLARATDLKPEAADDDAEPEVILRLSPWGALDVFAESFRHLEGLAVAGDVLYAAASGRRDGRRTRERSRGRGKIYGIGIGADGFAGTIVELGGGAGLDRPAGLALDGLGALYVTSKTLGRADDRAKRAVGKLRPDDARLTRFAWNLVDPRGLAFDAQGHLYVADGRAGRVLRFHAPPAPALAAPRFTRESPVTVGGSTEAGARVDLFADSAFATSVLADAAGAFTAPVALASNAEHTLATVTTAHGGDGLSSVPAEAVVTHDAVAPSVILHTPAAGAHLRRRVAIKARASDRGSEVAGLELHIGRVRLGATLTPPPAAPAVTASAVWNTSGIPDGAHQLIAMARDQAGNVASVARTVVVDNTPPETVISDGPSGTISERAVTFTVTGTDTLTATQNLAFAWRLDGGPFTPFAAVTSAHFSDLAEGEHRFEVKARDLAGNEDPTPAARTFTVSGLRVTITEPADGATVAAGMLLVRGTVEAGGTEVGVSVNGLPVAQHDKMFAVLVPVTTEISSLVAIAARPDGVTARHAVTLTVMGAADSGSPVVLVASPPSGVAPLAVGFTLLGAPPAAGIEADFDGDGAVDFSGAGLEGESYTYGQPGLYTARVSVVDRLARRVTTQIVIHVLERASLDARLQARWTALKGALRAGDVARAVESIHGETRAAYEAQLSRFSPTTLAGIDRWMTTIQLVEVGPGGAQYEMLRERDGALLSFAVWLQVDQDGLWRVRRF